MTRWSLVVVALAVASVCAKPVVAQLPESAAISVEVYDALDGRRLEGALVGLPDLARFSLTNASGVALLRKLPAGDFDLEVTVLGYGRATTRVHIGVGGLGEYEVAMNVQPFEIPGITVEGTRRWKSTLQKSGFYTRSNAGVGRFFDRNQLRDRFGMWSSLGQALRTQVNTACQSGFDSGHMFSRGSYGFGNGNTAAPVMGATGRSSAVGSGSETGPVVFLDGVYWSLGLENIPYDMVEGVEIYRSSATMPAQYAGFAPCGVVLVWTNF